MKIYLFNFLFLMFGLLLYSFTMVSQEPSYFMHNELTFLWESEDDLKVPESVFYNSDENLLYVSNINGNPTAKDGNGFISKLSLDGEIKELKWAEGMDAPKGMGRLNGFLYVTDIDRVHKISFATGEIKKTFKVDNAKFLNDIDVHSSGDIFISDMQTSKIYRIRDGRLNLWLSDQKLERTNGLYATNDYLYIGMANKIVRVGYKNKDILPFIEDSESVDGLKQLNDGRLIFSDWQGRVYSADSDKPIVKLLDTRSVDKNAADIEYSKQHKMLFVPTFSGHTVSAYKVSGVP